MGFFGLTQLQCQECGAIFSVGCVFKSLCDRCEEKKNPCDHLWYPEILGGTRFCMRCSLIERVKSGTGRPS